MNGYSSQYKPWRKGKGTRKSGSGSGSRSGGRSLKNQLRGKERFLSKLQQNQNNDAKTKQLIETVTIEIEGLKNEIKEKENIERQKKIAVKYHQVKFFERQKLTRMERKINKKLQEAKEAADFEDISKLTLELQQICMDQLYVAFYPNDRKYLSIFDSNTHTRIQDNDNRRIQQQRIDIKKDILMKLKNEEISKSLLTKKSWVNFKVLKENDFDLSLAEISVGATSSSNNNCEDGDHKLAHTAKKRKLKGDDSVKSLTPNVKKKKENPISTNYDDNNDLHKRSSSSSSSDDSYDSTSDGEDDDTVDKLNNLIHASKSPTSTISKMNPKNLISSDKNPGSKDHTSSTSSSSDDNSSGSSSSDSDDSSDNSADSDSNDKLNNEKSKEINGLENTSVQQQYAHESHDEEESDDDFLVDDIEQDTVREIFAKASREALSYQDMPNEKRKADKSKGWQTQKQRPGEWKGDKHHKRYI